jgi:hypothetical protein
MRLTSRYAAFKHVQWYYPGDLSEEKFVIKLEDLHIEICDSWIEVNIVGLLKDSDCRMRS